MTRLDAYGLNHKHGFEDGDMLGEPLMRIYPGTIGEPKDIIAPVGWMDCDFEHVVLYRLVVVHLLPLLPAERPIFFMHTHHNPVRFKDYERQPDYTPPIFVDLTDEQIAETARWVEAEWAAGRSGIPPSDDDE